MDNIFDVERLWNPFPQRKVETDSLNIFKAALDKLLISKDMNNY